LWLLLLAGLLPLRATGRLLLLLLLLLLLRLTKLNTLRLV